MLRSGLHHPIIFLFLEESLALLISQNVLLLIITFPINVRVHCRRPIPTNSLLYRLQTRSLPSNLNEEGKWWTHQGNLLGSSCICSVASAGNMVQEHEDEENENEPDKNSFFNVYFRERLVID